VAVIDEDTGKMKRFWGAYGNKPDDANTGRYDPDAPLLKQFRSPVHCRRALARQHHLRVRPHQRPGPVVPPDGTFIKEVRISPKTLGEARRGTSPSRRMPLRSTCIWPTATTRRVWVLDRASMEVLTSFGDGGKQPGQFYAVHSIDGRLEGGKHLHDGNLRRSPPCSVSC